MTEIAGQTAQVFQPSESGRPRFGIIHLHEHGMPPLFDRLAITSLFTELGFAGVSLDGQQSWWADRVCTAFDPLISAENYILQHVLPSFRERWNLTPRGIGITGFGDGGQGALRLAFKHPTLFPVVSGISSAIDYYDLYGQGLPLDDMYNSKEQCRQDSVLMHIHPSHYPPHIFFCIDPEDAQWYRGNDRLVEKLNALGIQHEADLTTEAGGHTMAYFEHVAERALRFMLKGLEYESRRLL